jgi:hypothetical protein
LEVGGEDPRHERAGCLEQAAPRATKSASKAKPKRVAAKAPVKTSGKACEGQQGALDQGQGESLIVVDAWQAAVGPPISASSAYFR